jgi:hypothetical protein
MRCRGTLENKDGVIIAVSAVAQMDESEKQRWWLSAASVIRMQVKDALQGLVPIYGEEFLQRMCAEVIAEDKGGLQTKSY